MQLKSNFSLLVIGAAALSLSVGATPAAVNMHAGVVSLAEMKAWVDAQDPSNITLIGDPFAALRNPLSARDDTFPNTVTVTFCSTMTSGSACAGPCTTITSGAAACINAPGTSCLFATHDLAFCGGTACQGICNGFASCGVLLQGGFCATPGTQSISVPAVTSD